MKQISRHLPATPSNLSLHFIRVKCQYLLHHYGRDVMCTDTLNDVDTNMPEEFLRKQTRIEKLCRKMGLNGKGWKQTS